MHYRSKLLASTTLISMLAISAVVNAQDNPETTESSPEQGPDFYTPAPAIELLGLSRQQDWIPLQEQPDDLMHISMGEAGTADLFIAADDGKNVSEQLELVTDATLQSSSSYDILLRSMFQLREQDDGSFSIVPSKHPNYALDVDEANRLILRNIRHVERDHDQAAYLGFEFDRQKADDGSTILTLTAESRWVYAGEPVEDQAPQLFERDRNWKETVVVLNEGELQLSEDASTAFAFYKAPINFEIPFDFNPDKAERADNDEVTPFTRAGWGDRHLETPSRILDKYADQLAARGLDEGTTAAARAMLDEIEQSLAEEGAQLRYPPEFYMTFREGMLERVYLSSESTDAHLGQLAIPYVHFTNAQDEDGVHHPFMVISTYGLPDTMALLWDVAMPPGDGSVVGYQNQQVTRSYHREGFMMKVPMRDYGEVESLGENIMVADLASDRNVELLNHHNYSSVSGSGVAIDGVVVYPTLNNALHISAAEAELSAHGQHSGRGLGTHYHADSYAATGEILNLYNSTDYEGRSHPPIITIGFDGVAGYGIYRSASSDGASVPLDQFGGHEHGDYGYHYHSVSVNEVTRRNTEYVSHKLPPLGAWAGRINDIPDFWRGNTPGYGGRGETRWLGTGTAAETRNFERGEERRVEPENRRQEPEERRSEQRREGRE